MFFYSLKWEPFFFAGGSELYMLSSLFLKKKSKGNEKVSFKNIVKLLLYALMCIKLPFYFQTFGYQ